MHVGTDTCSQVSWRGSLLGQALSSCLTIACHVLTQPLVHLLPDEGMASWQGLGFTDWLAGGELSCWYKHKLITDADKWRPASCAEAGWLGADRDGEARAQAGHVAQARTAQHGLLSLLQHHLLKQLVLEPA